MGKLAGGDMANDLDHVVRSLGGLLHGFPCSFVVAYRH